MMRHPSSLVYPVVLSAVFLTFAVACGDNSERDAETPRARTEQPTPNKISEAGPGLFRLPAIPLPSLDSVVPDPPPPAPEPAPADLTANPALASEPASDTPASETPSPPEPVEPATESGVDTDEEEATDEEVEPKRLLSLADYAGEPLVVHFFASWCEACRQEIEAWQRIVGGAARPATDAEDGKSEEGESEGSAIRTVGILEEQHPERAKLYLQWQRLDFPVLVDALDLYRLSDLPVTLLVDRAGNARFAPAPEDGEAVQDALAWMREEHAYQGMALGPLYDEIPDLQARPEGSEVTDEDLELYAQALFHWGGPESLDAAVGAFEDLLERDPDVDGWRHFRLGTLFRARHDSEHRRADDFTAAVHHWQEALARAPHNQIFRSRLQQYGPRMTKPQPFYDWLDGARQTLIARGEVPTPTPTPLTAAEIEGYAPPPDLEDPLAALPPPEENPRRRTRQARDREPPPPVPEDQQPLVTIETVTVPAAARPGEGARTYLSLTPADGTFWQPGSQVVVRLQSPPEWRTGAAELLFPTRNTSTAPATASPGAPGALGAPGTTGATGATGDPTTGANRRPAGTRVAPAPLEADELLLEMDVRIPENARRGRANLPAEVLYNVCDDGGCRLLRQDLPLTVEVDADAPALADRVLRRALEARAETGE